MHCAGANAIGNGGFESSMCAVASVADMQALCCGSPPIVRGAATIQSCVDDPAGAPPDLPVEVDRFGRDGKSLGEDS